jgi:Protein of unknown function (DUF5818)
MKCLMNNLWSWVLAIALLSMTAPTFGQMQKPNRPMPPDPQQSQAQKPSAGPSMNPPANPKSTLGTFNGTISESQDGYVLNDSSGTIYQLDDQKKAKAFAGQSVNVTGTLDVLANMIHVRSIKRAS